MNNTLNVFVRQDLKMRKGKMAAQSSHTAQKLLLEAMRSNGETRIMSAESYREFRDFLQSRPVKIHTVKDDEALNASIDVSRPYSKIIDSGRTEFKGVPTLTCAAQGIFSKSVFDELHVPESYGHEIRAKQLYVFSKQHPLSKDRACEMAAVGCLVFHASLMEEQEDGSALLDVSESTEFGKWVSGAFAKIALGVPTDVELAELKSKLELNGIHSVMQTNEENMCLVIEPKIPANIDPFTQHLTLI
jgi:peptidyl-tRNA hydrolase